MWELIVHRNATANNSLVAFSATRCSSRTILPLAGCLYNRNWEEQKCFSRKFGPSDHRSQPTAPVSRRYGTFSRIHNVSLSRLNPSASRTMRIDRHQWVRLCSRTPGTLVESWPGNGRFYCLNHWTCLASNVVSYFIKCPHSILVLRQEERERTRCLPLRGLLQICFLSKLA